MIRRSGWWRCWVLLLLPPILLVLVTTGFIVHGVWQADGDRSVINGVVANNTVWILILNHSLLALLMWWFMRLDGFRWADIGWALPDPVAQSLVREVWIGVVAGGLIYLIHHYVMTPGVGTLLRETGIPSMRAASASAPLGSELLAAVGIGIVFGGIVEEHVYRGYILTRLQERLSVGWALVPLTLGFALLHFGLGISGMLVAGTTGLLLSLLFVWRRLLPAAIVAHAMVNTLVLLL
ncbi:MAG: CPBP family intramembrane glutamic endopeptidase [Pseudomonadota bacterium]